MTPRCWDCGRFGRWDGSSSAAIYDLVLMELSHEHWRCRACTSKIGPVESNAKPADNDLTPYQSVHR